MTRERLVEIKAMQLEWAPYAPEPLMKALADVVEAYEYTLVDNRDFEGDLFQTVLELRRIAKQLQDIIRPMKPQ